MSAIAAIYERSNTPVEPGVLERVMARMVHRGPDGQAIRVFGSLALGHLHFWTTPEEVDEQQPLAPADLPFQLALDGRLDNRDELITALHIPPADGKRMSDAALALRAYAHWGKNCFEHFLGDFALVIWDAVRSELLCARDPLGERTLFYCLAGSRLVLASEAWAAVAGQTTPLQLNQDALICHFALDVPPNGQYLFESVYQLLPGQVVTFSAERQSDWLYWQPDFSPHTTGEDEELAQHFLYLIQQSVRARMRAGGAVGVMMSGGLDSTSVACLAAEIQASTPLTTVSYVFDELPECDERQYMAAMQQRWNLHAIQFPSDSFWPFKNWRQSLINPNRPEGNLYSIIQEQAFSHARQAGMQVLLTGNFGDHLYSGGEEWLGDLLLDGRLRQAVEQSWLHLRSIKLARVWRDVFLRRAIRQILSQSPIAPHLHRRPRRTPEWLTPFSATRLRQILPRFSDNRHFNRNELKAEARSTLAALSVGGRNTAGESFISPRYGLELRHPFRDRRLLEFALSLPAYKSYYNGRKKHILRLAMRGRLPESIRNRPPNTTFLSLYRRGLTRERDVIQSALNDPQAPWRQFVRSDWLASWQAPQNQEQDGASVLLPFLCLSFTRWYQYIYSN